MAFSNIRVRYLLIVAIVFLATVALVEITIPHIGILWHLAHTGQAAIDGHLFTVPSKYFLSHSEGRLTFQRFSPIMPLVSKRWAISGAIAKLNTIGIYTHQGNRSFEKDIDYLRLKEWLTNEAKRDGLMFESERSLSTQIGTAYCFQFNNSQVAQVRCFLDKSTVTVFFDGEPQYANDVYLVVSGANRVN